MTNDEILALAGQHDGKENNGGKKFDVCLMNPPYGIKGNNLANNFLNKCIEISNKTISIQPPTFLIKAKNFKKNQAGGETLSKDLFNKYYTEIDIFNNQDFKDITISQLLGIFYIDRNKEHKIIFKNEYGESVYDNTDEINKYNDNEYIKEFDKITQKIVETTDNVKNQILWTDPRSKTSIERQKNDDKTDLYFVNIPYIHGVPGHDDMYTILTRTVAPEQHNRGRHYINFKEKNEAQNFINYLKTDFVRMILWLVKNDTACAYLLYRIPWFDFSDEHFSKTPKEIDNWLFEKYNISNEIRQYIEKILPDYYGIR